MSAQTIKLLQLYPGEMNIYGDWGNTLTLKKRLEWRGYQVELIEHHPGGELPEDVDLIVGGGGQDSGQDKIREDLLRIGPKLCELAERGVPMLMICGMYQLFGRYFETAEGDRIEGIGLFKAQTIAGPKRLIGNIVTKSSEFGDIVGYENHSGLTVLDDDQKPLAKVVNGAGNNGKDGSEGAIYKNVIGTYLHGSLLPKNPVVADWLLQKAVENKFGDAKLNKLDDALAGKARQVALRLKR